ncbi:MAG TPA: two-component regulator propeller domain-containing protein [Cytophagaceae bacterium]|nr:two-component regulator propeller domain-containing protein [Cytophagaceae bacterium]
MFPRMPILLFVLLISLSDSLCQDNNIPLGQWRLHTPYTHAKSIDIAAGKIYVACLVGSMVMDQADNSFISLSKINGLSDYDVDKYKYNNELGILLLAYSNGNIDLMKGNSIINVSDIKRKSIVGSKNINHIYFWHDSAFLSCDYGISLLDLKKNEIKESYENLGKGGLANKIYATTMSNSGDSIFIASDSGVMVAPVSPYINLQDYNNWYLFKTKDSLPLKVRAGSVCTLNSKVYAGISRKGIYVFNGTYWEKTSIPISDTTDIASMNVSGNKILICAGSSPAAMVISFDGNSYNVFTSPYIAYPTEAVYDSKGILWIADGGYGIVHNLGGTFNYQYLNGPGRILPIFKLYNYGNNIVGLPGGFDSYFAPVEYTEGYYEYDNNSWKTYDIYNYPILAIADTYVDAVYNPANGSFYIASFRNGLIERKSDGTHVLYDNVTPLPGGCSLSGTPPGLRMSGLAIDQEKNVWATSVVGSGISSLAEIKPNGTCVTIPSFSDPGNYAVRIAIDDFDNKWIQSHYYGILVYNEKTAQTRFLSQGTGAGNLPNNYVTAMEKDKKGQMWIGTKSGVAVFYDPSIVFTSGTDAVAPTYKHYPLLFGEYVTCIQVDGGNRKWIGTQNGLWLFNEDGTQVVANYTTMNSPILSNFIIDLEINKQTGELFIATDKGIIAYRSDATDGTDKFKDVKVFPNPVTENFNGLVGISGLATNANVKITDIYGNLIYETTAHGGTASWNLKNYNGVPAVTGVYLIYSTTTDGAEGFVSKIAVVR